MVKWEALSAFLLHEKNLLIQSSWLCLLSVLILAETIGGLGNPESSLTPL